MTAHQQRMLGFTPVGRWHSHRGKACWEGPVQEEDVSPENVRRCYDYLLSLPYQSDDDRTRLKELSLVAVAEAQLMR